jgi:hypothetical protein
VLIEEADADSVARDNAAEKICMLIGIQLKLMPVLIW